MDESLNQETAGTDYLVFDPRTILRAGLRWIRVRSAELLVALFLVAMSLQMLAAISRKSITVDEIVMIPAAYYHLAVTNFQLVNEHPPLSKILAGVPLLFVQPNEARPDPRMKLPNSDGAKWAYQEGFWTNNAARYEAISFWSRVPMILLAVGLGLLIFKFARELFGANAAVLAVMLYSLEPTVLAHGRVVQTDVPAAFGYLLFFMALYHYSRDLKLSRAVWLGVAAAIAILAKYSMLLTGPVLAAFFLAQLWRAHRTGSSRARVIGHAAIILGAIVLLINAAYFFQHRSLGEADLQWIQRSFPTRAGMVTTAVSALAYLLPADFVLGIFFQFWHNGVGHSAGLLGMHSETGWWYYFPVAFALKTTLPFLLLSLASIAWAVQAWVRRRDSRILWLLGPFALYTIFVLFSHIDIGIRYYLPAFPLLFILGGALLDQLLKAPRARRAGALVAVLLIGWMAVEAWRAYPNQLTYMNQLASGAPHWWYLSDSNVEWGDETRALASYLHDRGETRVGEAFLGGFFLLRHYGIEREDAPPSPDISEGPRYVAIGAGFLNGSTVPSGPPGSGRDTENQRVNFYDAYRRRTPEAIIGNSIYVFRVR